jgi:hypothetical protein
MRRPPSLLHAKALLFGLGLTTAVEFYIFDGVNLVLPDIPGSFGISRDQANWDSSDPQFGGVLGRAVVYVAGSTPTG